MILERFFTRLEIDITPFNQKKSNRNLFSSFEIIINFCNVKILSQPMSRKKIMWLVIDEPTLSYWSDFSHVSKLISQRLTKRNRIANLFSSFEIIIDFCNVKILSQPMYVQEEDHVVSYI